MRGLTPREGSLAEQGCAVVPPTRLVQPRAASAPTRNGPMRKKISLCVLCALCGRYKMEPPNPPMASAVQKASEERCDNFEIMVRTNLIPQSEKLIESKNPPPCASRQRIFMSQDFMNHTVRLIIPPSLNCHTLRRDTDRLHSAT